MDVRNFFFYAAGALVAVAYVPYIMAILAGRTKPVRATWVIWASLDTIILFGMLAKHTANAQIFVSTSGAWIVLALTFWHGKPGWSTTEKLCLAGACLAVVMWGISGSPIFGIVISLGVIVSGAIPTFISAWRKPANEDATSWLINLSASFSSVLAVRFWTLASAAQPVVFFLNTVALVSIIFRKRETRQDYYNVVRAAVRKVTKRR